MTFEPIDAVRPTAMTEDSHPVPAESDTVPPEMMVVAQRQPDVAARVWPSTADGHEHAEVVRALLRSSGLVPSARETDALIADFSAARAAVRTLYGLPEARYVDPGSVFRAAL